MIRHKCFTELTNGFLKVLSLKLNKFMVICLCLYTVSFVNILICTKQQTSLYLLIYSHRYIIVRLLLTMSHNSNVLYQ